MKRLVLIVFLLLALLLALPAAGEEASDLIVSGDYTYRLLPDGTAEIAGWNGTEHALQIPDTLDGHPVSAIGERAFEYKNCLSAVYIPGCVGRIGRLAFNQCPALISVSIGDHLAYLTCDATMNEKTFINIASIGMGAMDQCSGTVTLAESYGSEFQPIRHVYGSFPGSIIKYRGKDVRLVNLALTYDRFLASGFASYTRDSDEVEKMLAWEKETGITLLYPLLEDSSGSNASIWYNQKVTYAEDMVLKPRIARDKQTGEPIRWKDSSHDSKEIHIHMPAYYQYLYGFEPVYPAFENPVFTISSAEPCADGLIIEEGAFRGSMWLAAVSLPTDPQSIDAYAFSSTFLSITYTIPFDSSVTGPVVENLFSSQYTCSNDTALPVDPTIHTSGDFSYMVLEDQSARIVYCSAIDTAELFIPAELDGYPVTSLSTTALRDCTASTIHIPTSVKYLNGAHFNTLKSLTAIHVAEDHPTYSSIDGVLIDKTSMTLLSFPKAYHTMDYAVPQGIRVIGGGAFRESGLISVTLPDSVVEIQSTAFLNCTELLSVSLSDRIRSIGNMAFHWCTALERIDLPPSITQLGEAAFEFCESLTSISIPDGITVIEDRLLYGCTKLETIRLPEGITSIGYRAFNGCSSLVIDIPETVTSIGAEAFSGCHALTSITIPSGVEVIEPFTFHYCYGLTEITIPGSVRTIGDFAFYLCLNLEKVTILPAGSGIVGFLNGLFSQDSDTATTIGRLAFGDCNKLTSVTLSRDITFIHPYAFLCDDPYSIPSETRITFHVPDNSYAQAWCHDTHHKYEVAD